MRRSYRQQCGLTLTLDVVGERWTLLVLRELLIGPRRYGQLLDALPGIGTNLLAQRLKDLEAQGIVRRTAESAYALTDLGRELEPALLALARFGLGLADRQPDPGEMLPFRASWGILALRSLADPSASEGVHETYEFRVDDAVFHLTVDDRRVTVNEGHAERPVLVITTDPVSFFRIGTGAVSPLAALVEARVRAEGDAAAFARCARLLGLESAAPAPTSPGARP